jgi:hypothetical protein
MFSAMTNFFRSKNFFRSMTGTRVAMVAAPVALAGLAAPMMGAGPYDWHIGWGRHEPRRVEVVVRPPAPVIIKRVVDVVPCDLRISAYQAHGTVFVMVKGTNTSGGYATSLSAIDTDDRCPKLCLHNTPAAGYATQVMTPISLNAAFRPGRSVSEVQVRVGDRVIAVPVSSVACL